MNREVRLQGAIIRDNQILLIRHKEHETGRDYWLLPGGGRKDDETEEECIVREMKEETNLDVVVKQLLLDIPSLPGDMYQRLRTYLCVSDVGDPHPGTEPELDAGMHYSIVETRWFDVFNEDGWDPAVLDDPYTYPQLRLIRKELSTLEER